MGPLHSSQTFTIPCVLQPLLSTLHNDQRMKSSLEATEPASACDTMITVLKSHSSCGSLCQQHSASSGVNKAAGTGTEEVEAHLSHVVGCIAASVAETEPQCVYCAWQPSKYGENYVQDLHAHIAPLQCHMRMCARVRAARQSIGAESFRQDLVAGKYKAQRLGTLSRSS